MKFVFFFFWNNIKIGIPVVLMVLCHKQLDTYFRLASEFKEQKQGYV
ncbi:hypothetical protein [Paucisalibacillus sp. EB02]|nr:hypothetical protein [Paucisalibacillus sp. EB02]